MPMYGDGDEDGTKKGGPMYDDSLDACNPDNFKDFDEEESIVRR